MGTPHHHHGQMLVGQSPLLPNAESFVALLEVPPSDAMDFLFPSTLVPRVEPYLHSLVKDEMIPETDCLNPNLSQLQQSTALREETGAAGVGRKRKETDQKGKGSAKKTKKSDCSQDGQVLPYVHVRARRGQATDSRSLAERARREKINARMKLLQELVPGCNKISGTALMLDEIINHVQSLQEQVEVLSMKLVAVNSWIDFDVDNLIYSGLGAMMDGNFVDMSMLTTEFQLDRNSEMHYQQWPLDSIHKPIFPKEESQSIFAPEASPLSSNFSADIFEPGNEDGWTSP